MHVNTHDSSCKHPHITYKSTNHPHNHTHTTQRVTATMATTLCTKKMHNSTPTFTTLKCITNYNHSSLPLFLFFFLPMLAFVCKIIMVARFGDHTKGNWRLNKTFGDHTTNTMEIEVKIRLPSADHHKSVFDILKAAGMLFVLCG